MTDNITGGSSIITGCGINLVDQTSRAGERCQIRGSLRTEDQLIKYERLKPSI